MKKNRLVVIGVMLCCLLVGAVFTACVNSKPDPSTYTVTFVSEGETYKTQTVKSGDKVLEPKAPEAPEGKQFDYWTLDGSRFSFDTPITQNITLEASFSDRGTELFVVRFLLNYGEDPDRVVYETSVAPGGYVTPPEEPERDGYFFGGWRYQGEKFNFAKPVTSNLSLRAKWYADDTKVWNVTFDTGYGIDYDKVVDREELDVPEDPERSGYEFLAWYAGGVKYDFNAEVRSDLTLTALWKTEALRGKGTEAEPYLLNEYADFEFLGRQLNLTRGKDETDESWNAKVAQYARFASACYTMTEDVVMPAAISPVATNADYPFRGKFDARTHRIDGLKMDYTVSDNAFGAAGLFGFAERAVIENLQLVNVDLTIRSANGYRDTMRAGGIAGVATACGIRYCSVGGSVKSELYSEDATYVATSYLGGAVGQFESAAADGVATLGLISSVQSSVTVTGDIYSRAGGIVGVMNGMNAPTAIVNCYWDGDTVTGGEYAGGITSGMSYRNSIVNCFARGTVRGLSPDAYIGGIAAVVSYGDVIADCYSEVDLVAVVSGQGSTAGTIAAYETADDFEYDRTVGSAISNCWYLKSKAPVRGENADIVKTNGKQQITAVSARLFQNTLRWDAADWSFAAKFPTLLSQADATPAQTYRVTLNYQDATGAKTTVKTVGRGEVVGKLDAQANYSVDSAAYVFADWVYDTTYNRPYNYAMPVYKDMTLTAHYEDVSDIVGYWYRNDGRADFVIYFGADGTAKWLTSSLSTGTYFYTGGENGHICFTVAHGKGGAAASFVDGSDSKITFKYSMGMSDEIFNMSKSSSLGIDTALVDAYAASEGQMLYIVSNNLLYFEKDEETYRAAYSKRAGSENVYDIVFDKAASMKLTSASFTVRSAGGLSLETSFVGDGSAFAESASYSPLLTPDYKDETFLGTFWSFLGDKYGGSYFKIEFFADGSANVISVVGADEYDHEASFIYLPESKIVKLFYETYTTNFIWDEEAQIMYGVYNRGSLVKASLYLTREKPKGFLIADDGEASRENVIFVTNDRVYFAIDGKVDAGAACDLQSAGFVDGARVRITPSGKPARDYRIVGNILYPIGAEEGTYTHSSSGETMLIDGIGNVVKNGKKVGAYRLYDTLLVVEYDDDTLEAFDYADAQKQNFRYTEREASSKQGVWYSTDKNGPIVDRDGSSKLVFDGFGHVLCYYYSDMNTYDPSDDCYVLNYMQPSELTEKTDISSYTEFNTYNKAYFTSLKEDNIILFRLSTASSDVVYVKLSYGGVISAGAAFDKNFVRVWTQTGDASQRLSISDERRGSWNGVDIGVAFDGSVSDPSNPVAYLKILHLRADGKDYTATLKAGVLTLKDENGNQTQWVELAGSLPPDAYQLLGVWSGEIETPNFKTARLEIKEDLTATLNTNIQLPRGVFDDETDSLTWKLGSSEYKVVFNGQNGTVSFTITDTTDEVRTYAGTLTKA